MCQDRASCRAQEKALTPSLRTPGGQDTACGPTGATEGAHHVGPRCGPGAKRKVAFGRDPQPLAKDPSAPKPVPGAEGGCPGVPLSVEGSRRESGAGGWGKDRSPPHAASRRRGHSAAWDSPLRTWLSSGSGRPVGASLPRGPGASPTTGTAPCSWRAPARPRWGRPTQYCLLRGWGPEVDTRSTVGRRGHT